MLLSLLYSYFSETPPQQSTHVKITPVFVVYVRQMSSRAAKFWSAPTPGEPRLSAAVRGVRNMGL
jgi:hypothetical protein